MICAGMQPWAYSRKLVAGILQLRQLCLQSLEQLGFASPFHIFQVATFKVFSGRLLDAILLLSQAIDYS
jgi:hypothetical protein